MCVGQADTTIVQIATLNKQTHFPHVGHSDLWKHVQQSERLVALSQRSKGKFRDDERMDYDPPPLKVLAKLPISRTKVVNPYRRIGENQVSRTLRRGIFFNLGMVPPSDANLRALSRSISALRASRTSAVFSSTPVNS
jgi:hypothetical protein